MPSRSKSITLSVAVLLASCFGWQACSAADQKASCKQFVQGFYTWYLAKSKAPAKKGAPDPLEVALKTHAAEFSPELTKRLKEDLAASAKSPDGIVGLDFDPILNAQDNGDKYEAQTVTSKGNSYLVDVVSTWNGKKEAHPTVQPELVQIAGGKWQFVNFYYYEDKKKDDLLHILKGLREERASTKHTK